MNNPKQNDGPRFLQAESKGPRDEQQDAAVWLTSEQLGTALLVVSDGVGGNRGGRVASQIVVEGARRLWQKRNGQFDDPWADIESLCRMAHDQMNQQGEALNVSPRATVVALYLTQSEAYWVHSGDSRLYHFRAGRPIKRTEDHSVLQVMVKQGMVSEETMGTHPDQGRLLQS